MLTLICPGLGQMHLGARTRGVLTLIFVTASLCWLGWADYAAINGFFAEKVQATGGALTQAQALSFATDPELVKRVGEASFLPGWIFFLAFIFAFVDSAILVMGKKKA